MPLRRLALGGTLAAALTLAGCQSEPEQPTETQAARDSVAVESEPVNPFAEPARRALRIELGLDGYRTVEGTWAESGASSTFTAHFDGDTLRFIEERLQSGEGTNVYYFEAGALFYAVQDGARLDGEGDGTSRVRLALDADGRVIASERVVDGVPEPVRERTATGVRRRAEALRDRALREAEGPAV